MLLWGANPAPQFLCPPIQERKIPFRRDFEVWVQAAESLDEGTAEMSQIDLNGYQESLERKRAELEAKLRRRDAIVIEKEPDPMDEVNVAGERELAITRLDNDSALLAAVRQALSRIEEGTFGACLRCEESINPRRLDALPWALYCLRCQEALEREAERSGRREFLDDAA